MAELIDATKGFFKVHEEPVRSAAGRENPDFKAIVDEEGRVLGVHSSRYVTVPNQWPSNVIDTEFRVLGMEPTSINEHLEKGGARYVRVYEFLKDKKEVAKGDFLGPRVTLFNSYDGGSPLAVELGFVRLVCTNGMVSSTRLEKVTTKHVGTFQVEAWIKKAAEHIVNRVDFTINNAKALVESPMAPLEMSELYSSELPVHVKTALLEKTMDTYAVYEGPHEGNIWKDCVVELQQGKEFLTKWAVYNVLTAYLTHHVQRQMEESRRMALLRTIGGVFGL